MRMACCIIPALLLLPIFSASADYIDLTEQGNQAYAEDKYDDALNLYKEAQVEKPETPTLDYNIGSVLHQQTRYQEAVERYRKALHTDDPEFQADAYYNIGNTFFRAQQFAEAIAAYQKTLELRPDDLDAKYNLELSRKKLKEQAEQEQQQDNQQQQDQQQEQDQQDQQQEQQEDQQQEQQQQSEQSEQQQEQDSTQQQQSQQQQQQQEQDQQEQQQQQGTQGEEGQQEEEQQQPQPSEEPPPEGMSKEDAQRILNAIAGDEKELQKQLRRHMVGSEYRGKDW